MIEIDTMLNLIQTIGIIVGIFYYIMVLHNTSKTRELTLKTQQISLETRQAQLFMELYKTCTNYEFLTLQNDLLYTYEWENYEDFTEKYAPENNPELANKIFSVMSFFEGIGVLLEQNLISLELVYKLMHPLPSWIWSKMRTVINERRIRSDTPEIYEWFEYLVNESMRFEREVMEEKSRKRTLYAWTK